MSIEYPNDADGDALRRVASRNYNMGQPMRVDFPVVMPDEHAAQRFAKIVEGYGYQPSLYQTDTGWDVICVRDMVLTYDAVILVQKELDTLGKPLGGYSDGWGTAGK